MNRKIVIFSLIVVIFLVFNQHQKLEFEDYFSLPSYFDVLMKVSYYPDPYGAFIDYLEKAISVNTQ